LGAEFAKHFFSLGFKLVLISRNQEELNKLVEELSKTGNADEKTQKENRDRIREIRFDDAKPIEDQLKSLDDVTDVSILVNNAEVLLAGKYEDATVDDIKKIVALNTTFLTFVTYSLIKKLTARVSKDKGKEKSSAIINISSQHALFPSPNAALYSATKSYVDQFSESLAEEYWNVLDILSVLPYTISSGVFADEKRWFVITPE